MQTRQLFSFLALGATLAFFSSCTRSSDEVWDDTKSAGRYWKNGMHALAGDERQSRQVQCRSDFDGIEDESSDVTGQYQDYDYNSPNADYQPEAAEPEFIPLQEQASGELDTGNSNRPPREIPGERGSSVPGIEGFCHPDMIPETRGIFRPIYFAYNCSLIKGQENMQTLHRIAEYLRSHPRVCVFIEGHTDERGPQSYNLALGVRRSNTVRNALIQEGVNPDNLFTISYGMERPAVIERHEAAWSQNRRAEFKVYAR